MVLHIMLRVVYVVRWSHWHDMGVFERARSKLIKLAARFLLVPFSYMFHFFLLDFNFLHSSSNAAWIPSTFPSTNWYVYIKTKTGALHFYIKNRRVASQ